MRQYNEDEKLKIIKEYFAGKSQGELSSTYNVSIRTICRWVKAYNKPGRKGLISMKHKYVRKSKLEVIVVRRDFNKKSKESLKNYEKRVEKELALLQAKIEIMEKSYLYHNQNQELLKGNEKIQQNIKPSHSKPYLYECYKIIKEYNKIGLKKTFLLKLLKISDEGYRKWVIRGCPEWTPKYDVSYNQAISLIFYDDDIDYGSEQEYGHKRIAQILGIGRKKTLNAMKRLNLNSKRKKIAHWKQSKLKPEHKLTAPNLVKTLDGKICFDTKTPLEKIALDISEFKINNQKMYLWAFVDFHSRKIIHHLWSENQEKSNLMKALKEICGKYNLNNSILHTDRGAQFRSHDYWRFTEKSNINLSMTHGYASYQNALVETVFKTLKVVYFKKRKFKDINSFLVHMNHSIWKYNHTRFHTKINNVPQRIFEMLWH